MHSPKKNEVSRNTKVTFLDETKAPQKFKAATKADPKKASPKKDAPKKAAAPKKDAPPLGSTGVTQSSFVGPGIPVRSRIQLTKGGQFGEVLDVGAGPKRILYQIKLDGSDNKVWRAPSSFKIVNSSPSAGQN